MNEANKRIVWSVILFGICAFLLISFISYNIDDIPFNTSSPNVHIKNFGGSVGAYLVWALLFSIGWSAYFIPVLVCIWAISKITGRTEQNFYNKFFGFLFVIWSFSAMMSTLTSAYNVSRVTTGGILGFYTSLLITKYFGEVGTMIILGTIFVLSLLLATEFLIVPVLLQLSNGVLILFEKVTKKATVPGARKIQALALKNQSRTRRLNDVLNNENQESRIKLDKAKDKELEEDRQPEEELSKSSFILKVPLIRKVKTPKPKRQVTRSLLAKVVGDYNLPSLELLNNPPPIEERAIKEDLEGNSKILEETLRDFSIEVKVVEVEQGPVITRYELQPAPGVKITRILNLSDDIALSLKAPSVHIVAPIPGKGTVGVEVPNTQATMVYLKEVLETPEFQDSEAKLTLALGKEISGTPLVTNLADMPHLLIAGTTGSGKTVCVNSLIMSILYQASPEEVKLLMIDPKMVEMAIFNGLPHLICPVVTDVKKAAGALNWAVNEMEERYRLLAKVGVRNISIYNMRIAEGLKEIDGGDKKIVLEPLPYIVILIDELADLMLVAAKEFVEESITRLAQLSRAVGIHMILATQRPSVDVITGVIKANFPARISFRVASKVDSRTVLDMNGADKLLGKGDLLFLKPGNFKLIRAQGSLVSDKEIENVVKFAKEQRVAVYTEEVLKEQEKIFSYKNRENRDELFEEAAKLVIATKQASVSMLQRRLRLGYTRAARLVDMMEEEGIVGPFRGSKPRDIFVERWEDFISSQQEVQQEEQEEIA